MFGKKINHISNDDNKKVEIYRDDEHLYFDIGIANRAFGVGTSDETESIPFEFNVTYNSVILNDPSKYDLTVARMLIPGSKIPLFYMPGDPNNICPEIKNADPDFYSITLEYKGDYYRQYLRVIQRPESGTFDYNVNSVIYLMDMLNNAFSTAFLSLKIDHPTAPVTHAPYCMYDNVSRQFTIIVDTNYNSFYSSNDSPKIWFNEPLVSLLGVLSLEDIIIPELSNGRCGLLVVDDRGGYTGNESIVDFRYPDEAKSANYSIILKQNQGDFLNSVCQLYSFVIVSNSFGNRQEYKNQNVVANSFGGELNPSFLNTNYQLENTVFDLLVDNPTNSLTNNYVYTPTLYRWIDIIKTTPLNTLQFKVYFKLRTYNCLFPLMIGIGKNASVKFLFRKNIK